VVPQLDTLVAVRGDSMHSPVRDVTLDGIGVRDARYTYMQPHGVPTAGDWALDGERAAVVLSDVERVTVANCVVRGVDGNALLLRNYTRGVRVVDNTMSDIGGSAIVAWGSTDGYNATRGTQPRGTVVAGNLVHSLGLWQKQSSMYFQAAACQTTLQSNIFFDTPRAAVNFNDHMGGGNKMLANLIFNAVLQSSDHGAFNSWSRMPFLTKVRDGTPSFTPAVSELAFNFGFGGGNGAQIFDNDDGSNYFHIHHNVVFDADLAKMDFGGHDSVFDSNVAVTRHFDGLNCYAFWFPFLADHGHTFTDNRCTVRDQHSNTIGYLPCDAEHLGAPIHAVLTNNRYYTANATATAVCATRGEKAVPFAALQASGIERGSSVAAWPSNDEQLAWMADLVDAAAEKYGV